jgi:hypothetical protein
MSQGVALYVAYASDVLLICWFGTQLTQHVRQKVLSLLLLLLLFYCFVVVVVVVAVRISLSYVSEVSLQPGRRIQLSVSSEYFSVLSGLV